MGRPRSASQKWDPLIEHFGSPLALALKVGVSYRTLLRWRQGGTIPETSRKVLRGLAAEAGVKSPVR